MDIKIINQVVIDLNLGDSEINFAEVKARYNQDPQEISTLLGVTPASMAKATDDELSVLFSQAQQILNTQLIVKYMKRRVSEQTDNFMDEINAARWTAQVLIKVIEGRQA